MMRCGLSVLMAGLFALSSPSFAIPAPEQAALKAFFDATGGPHWRYTEAEQGREWFTAGLAECDWAGLSCNPDRTELQGIALGSHNLVGSLPPEIGQLSHLVTLEVSQNFGLGGEIPPTLTQTTLENPDPTFAWHLSAPIGSDGAFGVVTAAAAGVVDSSMVGAGTGGVSGVLARPWNTFTLNSVSFGDEGP